MAVAGLLLLAAAVAWPATRSPSRPDPWVDEADIRDQDIAFYQARIRRDPDGALDRAMLGTLFLQRARETGDFDDLVRAEAVARESFNMRARKNEIAVHVLATSLAGQHRYREALDEVRLLVANDSANHSYRALMGEIEMELGHYAAAESVFDALRSWRHKLTVGPRLARWEELNGHINEARTLLETAREDALGQSNIPAEQKAWFHLQVGDLAYRYGRTRDAERAWRKGLELSPADHRLLTSMSRLALSRHRWREAIRYGEAAIARSLDPATLGLLADAYTGVGDTAKAHEYARTMELVVLAQPGAYHRAWSLYLLNHDRQVATVLNNIRADMTTRQDIYGHDLLAWAFHKNGQPCEARQAMRHALELGTRDPMLLGHAKAIARIPCPSY